MEKFIKKLIAFVLSFALFISMTPINAYMSYAETLPSNDEVKTDTVTLTNPAYRDLDIKTYSPKAASESEKSANAPQTFDTIQEAGEYLKDQMIDRNGTIELTINEPYTSTLAENIFYEAVKDNGYGDSSAGDYLYANFAGYHGIAYHNSYQTTITYTMRYLSTYSQEQAVDREVKNVLDDLNVYNEDTYHKVLAVHDYIVQNIDYDYSLNNHSGYNAIVDKNVVCQGFASITCKMLKELGVGVRYITSTDHAWNIIKLNYYWYNTDNTWDENTTTSSSISYKYFLKGSNDFDDEHPRESKFTTPEFKAQFPTSTTNYSYSGQTQKSLSSATVKVNDQIYTGYALTPSVSVTLNGKTLTKGTDYTVSYSNNTEIGTATVTVSGIGNYTGKATGYFKILSPDVDTVKWLTWEEKSTDYITLSWNPVQDATKYQVYRSTSPYGDYEFVTETYNTEFTDTGLDSNTTYYYKVRAYKVVNSTRYYGYFSDILKVQTNEDEEISSLSISNYNYPTKIVRGNTFSLRGTISSNYLIDYVRVEILDENGVTVPGLSKEVYPYEYSFSDLDRGMKFGLLDVGNYTYRVYASDESGNEKVLIDQDFTVTAPAVSVKSITGLKYTNTTSSTKLSWTKASGVSGYEVWMYKSSLGYYTRVKTISGSSTNYYTRTGLSSATMYRYKVRAYKTVNGVKYYGKFTDEFVTATKPLTPKVTATSPSTKKVKLTWTNTSSKTTGYQIYRATSKYGTYKKVGTTTSKSFTNTGLTKGKYYYYKVRAYRILNNGQTVYSSYSSIKSVKVK